MSEIKDKVDEQQDNVNAPKRRVALITGITGQVSELLFIIYLDY